MSLEGFANAISQPVTKLIEVCAKGIGVLYEPYHLVRMAEAQKKAKEISGPSEIVGSQNIDGDLITQSLEGNPSTLIGGVPADSILINSKTRKQFQEEMHQKNIENIIGCAYKELKHEKNVSSETIDQSWLDIFFNSAEHIFDENLQVLWGKVMAGEIKQPGLYSLKTLSVLKVLSKKDAEKFAEISNSVFKKDDIFFIWAEKKLLLASGSNLLEKEDLVSLNLLNSESLVWTCFGNNQKQEWFEYGNLIVFLSPEDPAIVKQFTLSFYSLSVVGKELMSILPSRDIRYLREVAKYCKEKDVDLSFSKIISRKDGTVKYLTKTDRFFDI